MKELADSLEIVLEVKMNRGRLLKKQATIFSVELEDGKILECVARKNLKKDGLFVGDFVFVD